MPPRASKASTSSSAARPKNFFKIGKTRSDKPQGMSGATWSRNQKAAYKIKRCVYQKGEKANQETGNNSVLAIGEGSNDVRAPHAVPGPGPAPSHA